VVLISTCRFECAFTSTFESASIKKKKKKKKKKKIICSVIPASQGIQIQLTSFHPAILAAMEKEEAVLPSPPSYCQASTVAAHCLVRISRVLNVHMCVSHCAHSVQTIALGH